MATLYNLRTDANGSYRITKFADGEAEGSYSVSHSECTCPAGARPSCRHRQMLPRMLAHNLLNSPLFWDFERGGTCDLNGESP